MVKGWMIVEWVLFLYLGSFCCLSRLEFFTFKIFFNSKKIHILLFITASFLNYKTGGFGGGAGLFIISFFVNGTCTDGNTDSSHCQISQAGGSNN